MEIFNATHVTSDNLVPNITSYVDASTGMTSDSVPDVKSEEVLDEEQQQGRGQQNSVAVQMLSVERQLSNELDRIVFSPPVAYMYNPLNYAWETHSLFVTKFGNSKKEILFVGMNPGPWGMVQTGVSTAENCFNSWYVF